MEDDDELFEEDLENVKVAQDKVSVLLQEIAKLQNDAEKHPEKRSQIIIRLKELNEELSKLGYNTKGGMGKS